MLNLQTHCLISVGFVTLLERQPIPLGPLVKKETLQQRKLPRRIIVKITNLMDMDRVGKCYWIGFTHKCAN